MDHREVARYVARRLQEEAGDVVERVILFGSVARGDETSESDVDLVLVAEDKVRAMRALRPIRGDLLMEGAPIPSAMIFTPEEFEAFPDHHTPFYRAVLEEGETLVA